MLKLIERGELPFFLREYFEKEESGEKSYLENFDIQNDGVITFYTCKRCGFRVISDKDALTHYEACLEHLEWEEEHKQEAKK